MRVLSFKITIRHDVKWWIAAFSVWQAMTWGNSYKISPPPPGFFFFFFLGPYVMKVALCMPPLSVFSFFYTMHLQVKSAATDLPTVVADMSNSSLYIIGSVIALSTGLLTAVHKDYFKVLNYRELLFNDCGDRVAQLLHVQLAFPCSQTQKGNAQQEFLIVNTHLLFPHDSKLSVVRLHQVYKSYCITFIHKFPSLFFLACQFLHSF